MVTNRLMWNATFSSRFSHPCTVIDVLDDGILGVGVNMKFTLPVPWGESIPFGWAAFPRWPTAILKCARALQAFMPSYHVCSSLVLPAPPQLLNQEPPRPQQLLFPDFAMVPHFGHAEVMVVFVAAGVLCGHWSNTERAKTIYHSLSHRELRYVKHRTYVCRPPHPQTTCDLRFCLRHLHSSCAKHHQERNNWLGQISQMCCTLDMASYWE